MIRSMASSNTMSRVHKDNLTLHRKILKENFFIFELLGDLYQAGLVNNLQHEEIKAEKVRWKAVEMFLDILEKKDDAAYTTFITVLKNNHHEHVIKCLEGKDAEEGKILVF